MQILRLWSWLGIVKSRGKKSETKNTEEFAKKIAKFMA